MRSAAVALFVMMTAGVVWAAGESGPVRAVISEDRLTLSGIRPAGTAVVFGTSLRSERGILVQGRFAEVVEDADSDGGVLYEPRGGIPFRSAWLAVDLESGSFAVVSPEGSELDHQTIEPMSFKTGLDGLTEALQLERLNTEMLLIRPGEGAWIVRARDGGRKDGDKARDGRVTILFADAEPLKSEFGKAPKHLKAGDLVVALDPARLRLRTLMVTK